MNNRAGVRGLVATLIVLTACDKQPTGQSVAVVGGEEVSLAELNAELAGAALPKDFNSKEVMPSLLQRVVERKLLAKAALDDGIDRSPEFLTEERRMRDQLLFRLWAKRQADLIRLPTPAEIQKFIAANPAMFEQRAMLSLDQIYFDPPSDRAILVQIGSARTLEEVAATLRSRGIGFQKGEGTLDTFQLRDPKVATQISNLDPGEPFVAPFRGKMIASVIKARTSTPRAADENRKLATDAIRAQKLDELVKKRVEELRRSTEIEYQPAYAPKAAPATKGAKVAAR